jgi:hypothetical protein
MLRNQHFPPPKLLKGLKLSWSFYCWGAEKLKYLKIYFDKAHMFCHYSHQIYILNMYAKVEKYTVHISLKSG